MQTIFIIGVFLSHSALAASPDPIKRVLQANVGITKGQVLGDPKESCYIRVYQPGEFANDKSRYYIESILENSPAVHLAPYPNNGFVYGWSYDSTRSTMTVYEDESKAQATVFSIDPSNLKIKTFTHSATQTGCNLKTI